MGDGNSPILIPSPEPTIKIIFHENGKTTIEISGPHPPDPERIFATAGMLTRLANQFLDQQEVAAMQQQSQISAVTADIMRKRGH